MQIPYSRSTLANVQRSKILLSGARVYPYLPLHPLSRPGQGPDEPTGTACICATYQGRPSASETRVLLGTVRKLKCWNCLCMKRLYISTGLRMQVRTTLWEQTHPFLEMDAGCLPQSIPAGFQILGTWHLPMGLSPDQEAKRANMPHMHCSPTAQAEQCLGKGYLSGEGKGGGWSEEPLFPHQTWWDASSDVAQTPREAQF